VTVDMPVSLNQAGRKFNVAKVDGVSRRHSRPKLPEEALAVAGSVKRPTPS
jgi:hypothetical protein